MPVAGRGETLAPRIKNQLRAIRTALWFRPTAFCLAAATGSALLAATDLLVPADALEWLPPVSGEAVEELLKLLATGMLTVATVTLSVLMLVLSLAAGQASPRAVPELMADPVTQNALGTFLATFVYALTALLLLGFEAVGVAGATLVFFGALFLVLNALRYLVQWIHHVAEILKINRIISRIHRHASAVLKAYLENDPTASSEGQPRRPQAAAPERAVYADQTGYVQLIDSDRLHALAGRHDLAVRLDLQEGDFVHPRRRLMRLRGAQVDDKLRQALSATVVVGFERSHEGDPRFGIELLAEVACRSLSPGINDPKSALACIDHLGSLLAMAAAQPPEGYPAAATGDGRVEFQRCHFDDLLERALRPVTRDGAGCAEVIMAIMDMLHELAQDAAPAYLDALVEEAGRAEAYGRGELVLEADRKALARRAEEVRAIARRRGGGRFSAGR